MSNSFIILTAAIRYNCRIEPRTNSWDMGKSKLTRIFITFCYKETSFLSFLTWTRMMQLLTKEEQTENSAQFYRHPISDYFVVFWQIWHKTDHVLTCNLYLMLQTLIYCVHVWIGGEFERIMVPPPRFLQKLHFGTSTKPLVVTMNLSNSPWFKLYFTLN